MSENGGMAVLSADHRRELFEKLLTSVKSQTTPLGLTVEIDRQRFSFIVRDLDPKFSRAVDLSSHEPTFHAFIHNGGVVSGPISFNTSENDAQRVAPGATRVFESSDAAAKWLLSVFNRKWHEPNSKAESKPPPRSPVTCTACGWTGERSDVAIRYVRPCPKCGLRAIVVRKDIEHNEGEGFAVAEPEQPEND